MFRAVIHLARDKGDTSGKSGLRIITATQRTKDHADKFAEDIAASLNGPLFVTGYGIECKIDGMGWIVDDEDDLVPDGE